jgi:putative tricarboxylic transport membrane protein
MDHLTEAVRQVADLRLLQTIVLAAVYGVFFGAIPGLTATMAVALVVPLAYFLPPLHALAAVVTLAASAIFAGDIPGALVRMPGTPASAAYNDDVFRISGTGRPRYALGLCLWGSVFGGLFGTALFMGFARPLARVATLFTVVEYFWFYLIGLGCAVVVSRGSALKGFCSLLLGLLGSTVGLSAVHTEARFTFGVPELFQGVNFIPAMIGLFGLAELLRSVSAPEDGTGGAAAGKDEAGKPFFDSLAVLVRRPAAAVRSSLTGTLIGILPGAGADIAAWVSYGVSRRGSRTPERYGQGSEEGVVDAAAANNAALGGAWVPALVFGIPGDSITAIALGILMMKNLRPGPEIFEKQPVLVTSLYLVFLLANLVLIPVGWAAVRTGARLVRIPRNLLLPLILVFCILGAYAVNGSYFDVGLMLGFGVLGFLLDRFGMPIGPVVLGLILGGPLEERFIQSMTASNGSWLAFVSRPLAFLLAGIAAILWLWPPISAGLRRNRKP